MDQLIKDSLTDALKLLQQFIADEQNIIDIQKAGDLIVEAYQKNGKVLSCGNGGSLCDAMHFAEELTGRFRDDRKALPAIAIADSSHISCTANDYGYQYVFSRYVEALGMENDVLFAISTSGNSDNIIQAIKSAKERNMKVIGLSGKSGGEMKNLCDVTIVVPWDRFSDRIQEIHIKIIHILIQYIEAKLFQ